MSDFVDSLRREVLVIIGIDWDGTFTADPALWQAFIAVAQKQGHTCIIVTNRGANTPIGYDPHIPVLYCNGQPKRKIAAKAGYKVDVWIDDNPILVDEGYAGITRLGFCH